MAAGDGLEGRLEIGEGIDVVHLCGLDQRGDAAPGSASFVVTGEECVLAIEGQRPDGVLDRVGVDLDAAVAEEDLQPIPVPGDVAKLLAEARFGGDAAAARFEPQAEGLDQRCRAGLSGRRGAGSERCRGSRPRSGRVRRSGAAPRRRSPSRRDRRSRAAGAGRGPSSRRGSAGRRGGSASSGDCSRHSRRLAGSL